MTTPAAEALYLAQHQYQMEGRNVAMFNPNDLPIWDLPIIYGWNNGGGSGMYSGVLLAEDGTGMGGHMCSHEGYMLNDLGILEGSRPDRHETFREHYPEGYRMEWVPSDQVLTHVGLEAAYQINQVKRVAHEQTKLIGEVDEVFAQEGLDDDEDPGGSDYERLIGSE